MQTKIQFKPFTVVLTCGPSGVGKSYLTKSLMKHIEDFNEDYVKAGVDPNYNTPLDYVYLSSDEFRYKLLNKKDTNVHKFDPQMSHVSSQAFQLIESHLTTSISYPVNKHLVFIDSTALNKEWRLKIINICKSHNYNVDLLLFDFENRKDFHTFSSNKRITEEGIKRFYENVLPDLEKHQYNNIIRIKSREDLNSVTKDNIIEKDTYSLLNKHKVVANRIDKNNSINYVVGDLHGSFNTLKDFVMKVFECSIDKDNFIHLPEDKKHLENNKIILAGDLIDKGAFSKEILEFVLKNENYFIVVIGNHENFIYRYFKDINSIKEVPQHVIDTYFTSINQYKNDEHFKDMLNQVMEKAVTFLQTPYFIVTHAPTSNKYLGKIDNMSLRNQRNWQHPVTENRDLIECKEIWEKDLGFLKVEATYNHPTHLFGHICLERPLKIKNKLSLDSGAVTGNGLSYYEISFKQGNYNIGSLKEIKTNPLDLEQISVKDREIFKPKFYTLFNTNIVSKENLETKDQNRVKWAVRNKVNYISGTMAPASNLQKDNGDIDIESYEAALDYYKSKNVSKVIIQPKYMGSRCNVYIQPKICDCYMTSRNGYVIKKLHKEKGSIDNFRAFFQKIKESQTVLDLYNKYPNLETIILDGELLPWFALGKSLIENTYNPLHEVIENELNTLNKEKFIHQLTNILAKNVEEATNDREKLTLSTVHKLYKDGFLISSKEQIAELKKANKNFKKQVEIFGRKGNIEFKPFAILKLIMKDGSEILPNFASSFTEISTETYVIEDLNQDNYGIKTKEFIEYTQKNALEGIVIKPLLEDTSLIEVKQIAPYLKVRNKEYLRLVYGYDYLENKTKYLKLSQTKNTSRKVRTSINEFLIGQSMLKVPFNQIIEGNHKFENLVATMIVEEENEKFLDPRL